MQLRITMIIMALSLFLSGCSQLKTSDVVIMGDGLTTFYSLNHGGMEKNPILEKFGESEWISIGSIIVSYSIIYAARYMEEDTCFDLYRALVAIKTGASINNLAVIAGLNAPAYFGIATLLIMYQEDKTINEAKEFCQGNRLI